MSHGFLRDHARGLRCFTFVNWSVSTLKFYAISALACACSGAQQRKYCAYAFTAGARVSGRQSNCKVKLLYIILEQYVFHPCSGRHLSGIRRSCGVQKK
jgi:hypothetical protein